MNRQQAQEYLTALGIDAPLPRRGHMLVIARPAHLVALTGDSAVEYLVGLGSDSWERRDS